MDQALAWQMIKSEDVKALQAYTWLLSSSTTLQQLHKYMQELDMPVNMRAIFTKLQYKMREQWRTTAHNIMDNNSVI